MDELQLSKLQKDILILMNGSVFPIPVKPVTAWKLINNGYAIFRGKKQSKSRYVPNDILCSITEKGKGVVR